MDLLPEMATGLSPLIITCYYLELSVDCDSLLPPPWVRWAHHPGDYQSTGYDCVHAACCRYYAINFRSYTCHLHLLQWNNIWGMLTKLSFDWLSCYAICSLDCLWLYRTYIFTWGEQLCYIIFSGWLASSYFSHLHLLYLWKKNFFWLQQVLSTLIWYVFGYCMCSAVKSAIFTVLLLSYNNWGVLNPFVRLGFVSKRSFWLSQEKNWGIWKIRANWGTARRIIESHWAAGLTDHLLC